MRTGLHGLSCIFFATETLLHGALPFQKKPVPARRLAPVGISDSPGGGSGAVCLTLGFLRLRDVEEMLVQRGI
jgi:hypothetical protein